VIDGEVAKEAIQEAEQFIYLAVVNYQP